MNTRVMEMLSLATGVNLPTKQFVTVVVNPQKTKYLFGNLSEISGQRLQVLEINPEGDALCVFHGKMGANLVDVDHTDIAKTG